MTANKTFSEEERVKLMTLLPQEERNAYFRRLGDITLSRRIADDEWSSKMDKISEETDKLVADIKERLDKLDGSYDFGSEQIGP